VPHKTLIKNWDPEYYKEIKQLKSKVRKAYNRRKLGVHCTEKLKLSKQLLAAKKSAQEAFKCWSDFHKYVKRRKRNSENIPAIKDCTGRNITHAIEKANTFNSYYSTVFNNDGNILHIQSENTGDIYYAYSIHCQVFTLRLLYPISTSHNSPTASILKNTHYA